MAVAGTTTTTTTSASIYAEILEEGLLHELRPAMFMRPLFKHAPSTAGESLSYAFGLVDPDGVTASPALAVGSVETGVGIDGTAFTVRQFSTLQATATVGNKGIMAAVGDVTKAVTVVDIQSEITGALVRTMLNKWEVDATANLANFSNTTPASAGGLTYDDFIAAMAALEQRDVTAELAFGGHPKQLADVRSDMANRVGSVFVNNGNPLQGHYREAWGPIAGIETFASTAVASSGGNYEGAVFAVGEALGYLELWDAKVEVWRDGRALLDYIIVNSEYGSVEISDTRGQTVLSSTT